METTDIVRAMWSNPFVRTKFFRSTRGAWPRVDCVDLMRLALICVAVPVAPTAGKWEASQQVGVDAMHEDPERRGKWRPLISSVPCGPTRLSEPSFSVRRAARGRASIALT